jgi:hypothetical protein
MLAKDCMESGKGAAGLRIKNEMASRDFDLALARKASHQTGSDWWWVIYELGIRSSRTAHL